MSDVYTTKELSEIFQCCEDAIRKAIVRGEFKGSRKVVVKQQGGPSKRWLVPVASVEEFRKKYPLWPKVTTTGRATMVGIEAEGRCIVEKGKKCKDPTKGCMGCERLVQHEQSLGCRSSIQMFDK